MSNTTDKFRSNWIDRNRLYREEHNAELNCPHFKPCDRRVIVCLCGSTRFYDAFQEANYRETMAGKIVLSVGFAGRLERKRFVVDGCMGPQESEVLVARSGETVGCTPEEKEQLDRLHFDKLDLADEAYILNVGGYVGSSTRNEVLHAHKRHKIVRWLEPNSVPADLAHIGDAVCHASHDKDVAPA